ncbi:MAG: efflux RND transporter periplasmic adaptor subunit [Planctomycetota bacterium]
MIDSVEQSRLASHAPSVLIGRLSQALPALTDQLGARAAALIRCDADSPAHPIAVSPTLTSATAPPWLATALRIADRAVEQRSTITQPDANSGASVLVIPVNGTSTVVAFRTDHNADDPLAPQRVSLIEQRIELERQRALADETTESAARAATVIRVLAHLDDHDRLSSASMALVNALAAEFVCDRVSLGIVRRSGVRLVAWSLADKVKKRSKPAGLITGAMEACVEQGAEVIVPASAPNPVADRESRLLAERSPDNAVATLPLYARGTVHAAICLERAGARPFTDAEVRTLQLLSELVAPRIADVDENSRALPVKIAKSGARTLGAVIGPDHLGVKLWALASVLVIASLFVIQAPDRITGTATVRAENQRVISAPFDSFIVESHTRIGDAVSAGVTPLVSLDTEALSLRLAELSATRLAAERQAALAQRDGDVAQEQIARARVDEAEAQIGLVRARIDTAAIRSPITGVVIAGDLESRVGSAVRLGEPLFQIADLDTLRADIRVPGTRVAELTPGSPGTIVTRAFPDRPIPIRLRSIGPAADRDTTPGTFVARVELDERPEWLRPGMEGVARFTIGREPLADLATRRIRAWLRLHLW